MWHDFEMSSEGCGSDHALGEGLQAYRLAASFLKAGGSGCHVVCDDDAAVYLNLITAAQTSVFTLLQSLDVCCMIVMSVGLHQPGTCSLASALQFIATSAEDTRLSAVVLMMLAWIQCIMPLCKSGG